MSLTGLAFAAAFFGAMGLALFRHPLFGLYAYVAVFYLHPPSRWWGATLPDLRWALFAAIVTFIATLRLPKDNARESWASTPAAKLIIAYTIWLWIQMAWALDRTDQLDICILFTKYVILFYLIYRLIDTPQKATHFLMAHVLGCAYLGWLAFNARFSGRLEGVGGPGIDEANALAMQMGTGVAVAAMLMLGGRGWVRWACFLAMPFLLNTIVLSGSRGAFLALFGTGLALWYLKPRKHRKLFYAFAVLGVILFGMLASTVFLTRMDSIGAAARQDEEADRSAASRMVIIKAQWQMAKKYPFGAGHRGTAVLSTQYLDDFWLSHTVVNGRLVAGQRSSHNTFMSALVEQGIPGAVMWVWLWVWIAMALRRAKERGTDADATERATLAAAIGGGLAMVFVAGQFVDYLKVEIQLWLLVLLVVVLQLQRSAVTEGAKAVAPGTQPVLKPGVPRSPSAAATR
jgi:O-antigen ligase